jgi:hypothetical protein
MTSDKTPGMPPGEPRESLLKYFAEVWPAGQRIASVKPTEWSAERDREDDDEESAPPAKRGKRPKVQPEANHIGWNLGKPTSAVKVEWIVTSHAKWADDERGNDPEWYAVELSARQLLVIRVTPK